MPGLFQVRCGPATDTSEVPYSEAVAGHFFYAPTDMATAVASLVFAGAGTSLLSTLVSSLPPVAFCSVSMALPTLEAVY